MKKNPHFPLLFIGSIFIILGSIFTVAGYNIVVSASHFMAEAVSVEGIIVNITVERYESPSGEPRTRKIVSVDYEIDGVKYENTVPHYRSSMRIGDAITLYHLPDTPWTVKGDSGKNQFQAGIVFGIAGLFFVICGICFLNSVRRKTALKRYLKQHGTQIYAKVTEVETDRTKFVSTGVGSRRNDGVHYPYSLIKCVVMNPDTNEIKAVYKSWSIINDHLHSYIGQQVKVYLHPQDNTKYYVDLEDLLKA